MSIFYRIFGLGKLIRVIEQLFINILYSRKLGNPVKIYGLPIILIWKNSSITVGKNLSLISDSYFSPPGVNHSVILRTMNSNASIVIGNDVGISGATIVSAQSITIGNCVMLGSNVVITDTDFHPISPENRRYNTTNVKTSNVVIEDNVFIGMNTLVLKGVRIGKNSVIGAGSIVICDIPENCIAAGNPAKMIRSIDL